MSEAIAVSGVRLEPRVTSQGNTQSVLRAEITIAHDARKSLEDVARAAGRSVEQEIAFRVAKPRR